MLQQPAPTPPPTPNPQDIGQSIGDAIKNSVLQSVGAEVRAQRDAAIARRDQLQAQIDAARGSERRGLQAKLKETNAEIDKLNAALDKIDGKTNYTSGTQQPPPLPITPDQIPTTMIISVVSIIFIGFPLSIAFARLLWRRATHAGAPVNTAQISAEQAQRFDRLEHAVDAVAIEVERISENQRYLTKVLAEGQEKKLTG